MKKAKFILALLGLAPFLMGAFLTVQQKKDQEAPLWVQDKNGKKYELYKASYALVIGIDHYTAGWPDLPGVAKDIRDVKEVLNEQKFKIITAQNVDRNGLLKSIEYFISEYGHEPENRLLIYFAGHGHTITLATKVEMGYVVPADAPNPSFDEKGFKAKAIDMDRFMIFAKQIECNHVLFVFDSCFSGSLFNLGDRGAIPPVISYKTAHPVRLFITSGSKDERVPDKSIFKEQFIAGIKGEADRDGDGFVTGTELGEFLLKQVVAYSDETLHPQYGKIRNPLLDRGDFVFIPTEQEPIKPAPETSFEVEQEYWKSAQQIDTVQAYNIYLEKYPNGNFAKFARERIRAIQESEKNKAPKPKPPDEKQAEKEEPIETKNVRPVKLRELPQKQVQLYNQSIKVLNVTGFAKEIDVKGQVQLTLSVSVEGRITVDEIKDLYLSVTPPEMLESVEQKIKSVIEEKRLEPPLINNEISVKVTSWIVSYNCSLSAGKLTLTKTSF
jgi:hypothetical protein